MFPRRRPPPQAHLACRDARARRGIATIVVLGALLGIACGSEPPPTPLSPLAPTSSTPAPVASVHDEPARPPPPASAVVATPPIPTTSTSASAPPPKAPDDPRNAWTDPPPGAKRVVSASGTKIGTTLLAGPCVIPHLDAALRRKTDPQFLSASPSALDLDGDGVSDWRIFLDATNMTRTEALYVRRGPCGHFVGFLVTTANLDVVPGPANALRDLEGETACAVECCSSAKRETWRFSGSEYRRVKTVPLNPDCSKSRRMDP